MFKKKMFSKASKAAKQQPVFKQDYFNNCHRTYSCIHCRAHLANHDELISKLFQGNHGRAYLFNKVVNIGCKPAVQRELLTGLHAVADIYCDSCETTLGWKYEQAFVPSQKYKEGKYIIELVHMLKENNWDLTSYNARELLDDTKSVHKSLTHFNSLRVGGDYIGIGSSNYDCKTEVNTDQHRRLRQANSVSVEMEKLISKDNQVDLNSNEKPISTKQQQQLQIPLSIDSYNSENDENVAPVEIVVMKSEDIELLEISMDKLQLDRHQEETNCNSNINDDKHNDTSTSRLPMVSPNDSLCSSNSQSDLSSSSVCVTDSNSNDELAPNSSPKPASNLAIHDIIKIETSEKSRERLDGLISEDSTITSISTSAV